MDLNKFKELLKKQKDNYDDALSFLEVINKHYDETVISKYILYILSNDIDLLNSVLRMSYKDVFVDIDIINFYTTEFAISDNRRIDILIEFTDINDSKGIIIIENKINSYEHNNQCAYYYNYCNKYYSNYKQYYLYIFPDFNLKANNFKDDNFKKITYSELYNLIASIENKTIYEKDFKLLISNKLRSRPMDEVKKFLIENFTQIDENIISIKKDIDNIFDEFKDLFINSRKDFLTEFCDCHRTLRFYKNDKRWWNGWDVPNGERVYFYIEIKCEDNFNFYIQRTLKVYSKNLNTKINRYLSDSGIELIKHKYMDTFKVFERKKIEINFQILSNEWKYKLLNKAYEELNILSIHQEKEIEKYSHFK